MGWRELCNYGNKLKFTYEEFKVIIILIASLFIRNTVRYFSKDYKFSTLFWSLFMIYPALLDLTQVRFFLAESIVIFSFKYIIDGKAFGFIKYILGVIIAYTIHSSAIFYLLFLLAKIFYGKRSKLIYYISIFVTIICIIGKKYIIMLAALVLNQQRINRYFYSTESVGFWGVIAYTLTLILFICISSSICKIKKNSMSEASKKFFDYMYGCNIISTLLMPLTLFDTNFFRIQRIMWLFMYISLGLLIKENVKIINIFKINIDVRTLGFSLSVLGSVFYICVFNFNIVQGFLL